MRAAAVQLNSTEDRGRNLEVAERLVREAAADGAELVSLPEKWTILAGPDELRAAAEPLDGPSLTAAAAWARELGIHLVAGSIPERVEGRERLFNTSVLFRPDGEIGAIYRKIHMFDVDVGGVSYRESATEDPGDEIVLGEAGAVPIGMTVCYDLRFPELYRILAVRGARVITVPAAFTERTGRDHWEVLLRARAIENQVFVVAADQVGEAPPHYDSFGRSMIVDPWGVVLAQAPDAECFVAADLDLAIQDEMRRSLPALANRRPRAYRWPDEHLMRRSEDLPRPGPPEQPGEPTMAAGPTPGGV
jgi:predicted amidohydrolase